MDVVKNIPKKYWTMKKIHILVTEDAMDMAKVVTHFLMFQGIPLENITHCATLHDAVAYINDPDTTQIHLLITDWNIPDGDEGGAIIAATREKFPNVQVIVMTGNPNNLPEISENYNPNEFLPKPFDHKEFATAVSNCYKRIENSCTA